MKRKVIVWDSWDDIIRSEKYSSGQISDMTEEVGERIQATTIRGRGRQLGCSFGKRGQVNPLDLGERVCAEEDCRKIYHPKHHRQVRCSEDCELKARRRRSRERARLIAAGKGNQVKTPVARDGMNREGRNWIKYMKTNEIYFKMLFPKQTITQAVESMRI